MNEKGLIEQVLRIINANYNNIYVIDIPDDKVYHLNFTVTNSLIIKSITSYIDFIDMATKFVHKEELSNYFDAISLNKLENNAQMGNKEIKVKYRRLCETGEYRWYVNIINYLPFEGRKLIFMMSEDIHERLIDSEENSLKLKSEVVNYQNKLIQENESISDALYQINTLLDNNRVENGRPINDTKEYINSLFNRVGIEHPELNKAIVNKVTSMTNYGKPTILIVDDSSIIRNSLKRIFIDDYNILMAKNGNEAISLINDNILNHLHAKENIVGILLDLMMPESDGFAVLDYMESNNLFNRIPVAIISGDETRETRKRVYQYDIVDMLEKPFNTKSIHKRISKIINLYISSNNLRNVVERQGEELKTIEDSNFDGIKNIINLIVKNVLNSEDANKLKHIAKIILENLAKYPEYNLQPKFIDAIINSIALYNIGAIAMRDDIVVTGKTIKEEIDYGMTIIEAIISDEYELEVARNIIKYSFEMYNGSGYPNNLKGEDIPIEAQITNVTVRLYNYSKVKGFPTAMKIITESEIAKYNPRIVEIIKSLKKELRKII